MRMWIWNTFINPWRLINHPEIVIPLLAGFVIDCLIGDPYWMPHPIRLFGRTISYGERRFNNGETRRLKGALLTIVLISIVFFLFSILFRVLSAFPKFHLILASVFVFYGLANHSLIRESWKVIRVLNSCGLEAGRKQLSMIVGRDTSKLNEKQIRTAVLETLSENLSDGVVAPLFYYAVGGVPAMMAYKMANTLDSMIGYKSERYYHFGWFAAKFDDVLNYLPARLTAVLMVIISLSWRGAKFIVLYGRKHASPNAGFPEAALAGILNCRFGGPNVYHGKLLEKPFIGENNRNVYDGDVKKAVWLNFFVALLCVVCIVLVLCC